MTLLESCQYTPVSKVCTLEATYCPFDSRVHITEHENDDGVITLIENVSMSERQLY
jgi:hypothetical protein